jgi:hypothetical protein
MFTEVGDKHEALHVKVMEVKCDSEARRAGVTTQMYLKSLSLNTGMETYGEPVFIGGDSCRKRATTGLDGKRRRAVDLSALISLVDGVMTAAHLQKKKVKLDLVFYKTE